MARKKDNPLRGKFRDPPQEGNASIPAQADQEKDTDQFKLTDAPAEPTEAPTEPVAADEPAPEQADQGDVPAEPAEAPAEPGDADAPAPEQADQGDAPAEPAEAPAEPVAADTPAPEQADQGDAPAEPAEAPAEPGDADGPGGGDHFRRNSRKGHGAEPVAGRRRVRGNRHDPGADRDINPVVYRTWVCDRDLFVLFCTENIYSYCL